MTSPRRQWDELDDFVLRRLHANGRGVKWIARFMCCNTSTIHRRAHTLGLQFDGKHRWTAAEDAVLRKRFPDERTADLARDMGLRPLQVSQHAAVLGLHKSATYLASPAACRLRRGDEVGKAYRFPKGHVPANKGLRRPGWAPGRMAETQFRKGSMTGAARAKYKPVGTERICRDGYLERKVTDAGDSNAARQRRWVAVHRLVWESIHGPIPPHHIVRFKPGMHTTVAREITVDKLELVTLAENMRRNSIHNLPKPLKDVVQLRGRLMRQIHKREKRA
jgi:hypothetical protein